MNKSDNATGSWLFVSTDRAMRAGVWLWLMLLIVAPVIYAALSSDIGARAYDAATEHIYRGVAFSAVIADGVLYPRWTPALHWGLGSPLFTFQPPLPYYGMDLFAHLGISHPIGWRLLVAGGFALAFVGMYLLAREITGRRWPAIVAATAFLYAPYVLRNALERGSNEAYSMLLYPLVLWGLLWVAKRPTAARFILATLLWAACIASHVLGPLMLAPFAAVLAVYLVWRYRTFAPLAVLLVGGLLTAIIWAPMIPEQQWVHVERDFTQPEALPAQNPIPLDRLLALPAIYDMARDNNSVGDRVGVVHAAALLLGLLAALLAWRRKHPLAAALLAATVAGLVVFWLFTAASDPLWRVAAPLMGRLLYRTRLMGVQALAAALVCGLLVALAPLRWQRWIGLVACGVLILLALPSLYVELQHRYTEFRLPVDLAQVRAAEIRTGGSALTAFGEFTPRWRTAPFDDALERELGPNFDAQAQPLANPPAGVRLLASDVRSDAWNLEVAASDPATLTLRLLYYPRWAAAVDGAAAALISQPDTGYAQVRIPAGTHRVDLRYESTPAERAGLIVTGLTFIGLIILGGWAILRSRRARSATLSSPPEGSPLKRAAASVARQFTAGRDADDDRAHGAPPLWLLGALTALLVVKVAYGDPATTWLRCVSTASQVCGAQAAVDVRFPSAPSLRGYTVAADSIQPGGELLVDLYWQGEPGATSSLSSFVHVRNSQPNGPLNPRTGNEIWAQSEHVAPGGLLLEEFLPDKLYKDEFRVPIPTDMPPGEYFLEVGWFDPQSGEQLDPQADTIQPPLKLLWRSILLPSVRVR